MARPCIRIATEQASDLFGRFGCSSRTVHGNDLPVAADLLEDAGGNSLPLDGLWLGLVLQADRIAVGFRCPGKPSFDADVDLVVRELQRMKVAELGPMGLAKNNVMRRRQAVGSPCQSKPALDQGRFGGRAGACRQ